MFHDVYDGFECTNLANGLAIHTKEQPGVNWFYCGVVVHVGAREDPPGREGLAHLVEHLVSENIDDMTFPQLETRFKRLGGQGWFGRTSYLATTYKFHFSADRGRVQEALTLFGTMLLSANILRQIEEEKEIISREYHKKYKHPLARTWKMKGRPFLFANHPRLKTFDSAIGIVDEFMASTPQEIQAFYDTYYVPSNMSIICIGSLSRETMLSMVQQTPFSMQKSGERNPLLSAFSPDSSKTQEQIVHLSEFSHLSSSNATITCEWVIPLHFTKYCVRLLCEMLEELLTRELRYERSLTYNVAVDYRYLQECRTIRIDVETRPDAVSLAKELMWKTLRCIHRYEESFLEEREERVNCILRMDYSGYNLLETTMADLEQYQRLSSFTEELHQWQQIPFDQVVELAQYLTTHRHFWFIMMP